MLLICSTGAAIVGWILVGGACVPSIFLEEVKLQLKVSSAADMIFKAVNLIMILAAPGESPPPPITMHGGGISPIKGKGIH